MHVEIDGIVYLTDREDNENIVGYFELIYHEIKYFTLNLI